MSNILLVEPDKIIGKAISEFLQSSGHSVTLAGSAQQAVEAADKQLPDIVISEVLLASHNGIEFLYEFRSYPDWRDVPVLIYSRIPPEDIGMTNKMAYELNIYKILYKPEVGLSKLASVADDCLAKSA